MNKQKTPFKLNMLSESKNKISKKTEKALFKIFAFDNMGILKEKNQSKIKYHFSRIKWLYRYLTFKD